MARLRTFIAVPLARAQREQALAVADALVAADPAIKWVHPQNLHATLVFLGEVDNREIVQVCRLTQAVAERQTSFSLGLAGLDCFPDSRHPRVFWLGIEPGGQELLRLHDELELVFADLGCRKEKRPYEPHLTLGRGSGEPPTPALARVLRDFAASKGPTAKVAEIHVMASELTRTGPEYTLLGRAKLLDAA